MKSNRRNLAYTIAELCLVVGIVLLLAALLVPVLVRASQRSKDAVCASNLKQIHLAIALYRGVYDGDGRYGPLGEMGLPRSLKPLYPEYIDSQEAFKCSAGHVPPGFGAYLLLFHSEDMDTQTPRWRDYAKRYTEDAIIIADLNHNWEADYVMSPYKKHRATGLYLGGSVRVLSRAGDPTIRLWWNEEQ
jgi:type II secretory pathway pseudopilin PulG